ncbi:hypothetical protein CIT292_10912 [Citrobacter youngae ATCC 29220]|uniref:Uncharacterized protein n=1 Tax=Citrobacter youngae ATCC 29220 TaxID=500640 RepID=D4BJR7_9ENTR|nr:hypothetical protein CIT292_10912 [Citrobacter youngae ATCC 29220]
MDQGYCAHSASKNGKKIIKGRGLYAGSTGEMKEYCEDVKFHL